MLLPLILITALLSSKSTAATRAPQDSLVPTLSTEQETRINRLILEGKAEWRDGMRGQNSTKHP